MVVSFLHAVLICCSYMYALMIVQVQMAAYQSLGPFISTFADPTESGFCITEDGTLCVVPPKQEPEIPSSPVRTEGEATTSESTSGSAKEQ